MPLRISCGGSVLRVFSSLEGGPASPSPCLAWGCAPPCGQACFCVLALRVMGAARGRPRGGTSPLGVGRLGLGTLPRPTVRPLGRAAWGPLPTDCGCGGCGRGDPPPNPTARTLANCLARCGGGTRAPGGGAGGGGGLLPGCGASGVGRSPTSDRPSFGACGRGPLPTGSGCGGCGRGDPSPTPQRALLRAGFARCGGGTKVPGGGRLLPGCGASGVGRSSTLDRPSFGACGRGSLPTGRGCGGRGRGDSSRTPQRALLRASFARRASCLGVRRLGSGALPPPTARPLGVRPGPTTHWLWVRGARPWEPLTNPIARALASWLCALWGRLEGARGGRLLPLCGASGVRCSPTPDRPSPGACGRGPYPLAVGAGVAGVRTCHQPQRACSCELALRCGVGTRAPGGGRLLPGCGASGVGRSPTPEACPLGRAAGAQYPLAVGVGGVGVGIRHQPHSARSCELALRVVGTARGCPGGGGGGAPLAWVWGVRAGAPSHARPLVFQWLLVLWSDRQWRGAIG